VPVARRSGRAYRVGALTTPRRHYGIVIYGLAVQRSRELPARPNAPPPPTPPPQRNLKNKTQTKKKEYKNPTNRKKRKKKHPHSDPPHTHPPQPPPTPHTPPPPPPSPPCKLRRSSSHTRRPTGSSRARRVSECPRCSNINVAPAAIVRASGSCVQTREWASAAATPIMVPRSQSSEAGTAPLRRPATCDRLARPAGLVSARSRQRRIVERNADQISARPTNGSDARMEQGV